MNEYAQLVKDLAKPGSDILDSLTPELTHLLHMAIGIAGEAGEIIDAIKKAAIYEKELDMENTREELGDLEFYMEGLRQGLGLTREECLSQNIRKLRLRHGKTYSNKGAIERKDKQQSTTRCFITGRPAGTVPGCACFACTPDPEGRN